MDDTLHIYSRVSTKEQSDNNTSLDTQRTSGIRCSEHLGISYKVWNEGAQSSFKDDLDNRPILVELLGQIDAGNVKKLFVWNTDRLSRSQLTWSMIRHKLKVNDVSLYTASDMNPTDLTNAMDDLLVGVLSEISAYDNKLRTERFRIGKLKRIKEGGWIGGPPPYGYEIKNKKLVINEYESKWVKFIFERYSEGISVDVIRSELLKNGVVTRRNKPVWSHGSINALISNTHYEGYYKMTDKKSGETIRTECDPILTKELVNTVRKEKKKRSYNSNAGNRLGSGGNQRRDYLLKGLLVCGSCNKLFGGRYFENQNLNHYYCVSGERKWKEKGTDKENKCVKSKRNLKINITDELVWNTVMDVITNSVLFKEDIKDEILNNSSVEKGKNELNNEERKLKKIDKELKDTENTIVELETDRLLKKRTDAEVEKIIKNIESHRVDLEQRKDSIVNLINGTKHSLKWVDWVNEFSDRVDSLRNETDLTLRKKFLDGLLDKIIVNSDDKQTHSLRLFFKIPYIDDTLIWNDDSDRSKGYELEQGLKSMVIDFDGKNYPLKKSI